MDRNLISNLSELKLLFNRHIQPRREINSTHYDIVIYYFWIYLTIYVLYRTVTAICQYSKLVMSTIIYLILLPFKVLKNIVFHPISSVVKFFNVLLGILVFLIKLPIQLPLFLINLKMKVLTAVLFIIFYIIFSICIYFIYD
jgi:hypothetical protein